MRVIPIAAAIPGAAPSADCGEESGEVRKLALPLARRKVLKGSGTGIIAAHITRESKNTLPLNAPGSRLQVGARQGAVAKIATHTAMPITGSMSSNCGARRLQNTLAATAATKMMATMDSRAQSSRAPLGASFMMGCSACCWRAAMMPKMMSAGTAPA